MERRALLAIGLSLIVLWTWTLFFAPKPADRRPAEPAQGVEQPAGGESDGSGALAETETAGTPQAETPAPDAAPAPESPAAQAEARQAANEETVTVENGLERVLLSNRGGRIVSWTLLRHTDDKAQPYELVSEAAARSTPPTWPLALRTGDAALDGTLGAALYEVTRENPPGGGTLVRFDWADGKGLAVEKTVLLAAESYFAEVSARLTRDGREVPVSLLWGPGLGARLLAHRASTYDYIGQGVVGDGQRVRRVPAGDLAGPTASAEGAPAWAGLEEQYFTAFFLPRETSPPGRLEGVRFEPFEVLPEPGGKIEKHIAVSVSAAGPLRLYAGPKEYDRLKGLGLGCEGLVHFDQPAPLIGPILGPVIAPLALGLYFCLRWLYGLLPNWGVAIILLTTAIKIAFYPLTQRSFVKMRKVQQDMQRVQPKVTAIREKYRKQKGAEARQKLNQEIMQLYQKEGINPLGGMSGCLPLLIQLPFLYAFYNVLTVSIELRKAPFFGWIQDLSQKDPWYITPLLMGATMFIQQRMAMTKVTDPQQRAQQRMMLFMPLMFTAFFLNLPSGLTLYWFVSNLLQIGQQVLINRQADRVLEKAASQPGSEETSRRGGEPRGKGRKPPREGVVGAASGRAGGDADR